MTWQIIYEEREEEFHLDENGCTIFLKKMKLHETSIGVNKFYFIP
jgi:hypothetical protein